MKRFSFLIFCLTICIASASCAAPVNDVVAKTETNETTAESITEKVGCEDNDKIIDRTETLNAWHQLNAVTVTWGEVIDETWTDTCYDKDRNVYSVVYVGVEVTFDEIYRKTMSESGTYSTQYEAYISSSSYVLIPENYLDDIEVGGRALLFLEKLHGNVFGCDIGGINVADDSTHSFDGAPIFNIVDGAISVPEEMYEKEVEEDDEYNIEAMYWLMLGNTFMEKNYPDVDIRFEDGMTIEEFGEFVEYLCTEADGLIYP